MEPIFSFFNNKVVHSYSGVIGKNWYQKGRPKTINYTKKPTLYVRSRSITFSVICSFHTPTQIFTVSRQRNNLLLPAAAGNGFGTSSRMQLLIKGFILNSSADFRPFVKWQHRQPYQIYSNRTLHLPVPMIHRFFLI